MAKPKHRKQPESRENAVSEAYLHLSNGGFAVEIDDHPEYGPTARFSVGSFGNCEAVITIKTTPNGLRSLRDVFQKAVEHDFGGRLYCNAVPSDCYEEPDTATPIGEITDSARIDFIAEHPDWFFAAIGVEPSAFRAAVDERMKQWDRRQSALGTLTEEQKGALSLR